VALLLTLRDGGARLVSTGNLNTTLPEAVEALRAEGITVIGGPTKDSEVHASYLDEVLPAKPDLILDNGGDLFARYLDRPYEALLGGTEETTSGRMRLEPLRGSSSTRSWSSTTARSSNSPRTSKPSARARSSLSCG
jgi:adenosylhomocysteinase